MYSLQQEQPKTVKGLSSWVEIAVCSSREALVQYANSIMSKNDVWKIEKR